MEIDLENNRKQEEPKKDFDVQIKIVIVGDSGVGKSCILSKYLKNTCTFIYLLSYPFSFTL
jgi:GTPase SAR1 family protein